MKRGKPLRRSGELKRGGELKRSDLNRATERAREFLQRGRQQLERTEFKRQPRPRPVEGPLSPAQWRVQVFEASEGMCIITGARARDADDRRFQVHHPLPKRELRARGLFGRVWDPRNGVWLRRDVHARHELAFAPVPYTRLPAGVWEFCAELDALDGTKWATDLVLRHHPAAGSSGVSHEEEPDGEGRGDGDRPEG